MELCDFEKDLIRLAAGLPQESITSGGAALAAFLGPLKRAGYLKAEMKDGSLTYLATEKGIAAVSESPQRAR